MASEGVLKAGKNIWAWQKRLREMPSVYWTESLGEPTGNYYLTREAAQLEVDYNDDHKDKYLFPKVTIRSASLHNMELSQERWTGVTAMAPAPSPGVTSQSNSITTPTDIDGMLEQCPHCHGYHSGRCHRSPARDYDFHGNPPNLPARPELDKDEGGRDEPVGRCDVTIFGHTPAPHVEGKYCINWKPCDDSSSASGREKGGLG